MNKQNILVEIKSFLDGYNSDLKYLVNVETAPASNLADCIIHEPNQPPKIIKVRFTPFMYMKDLSKSGVSLYIDKSETYIKSMQIKHGIMITKLKTGNQKRLVDGYCYKIISSKSFNDIITYLRQGGIDPYAKLKDGNGNNLRDKRGDLIYIYRENFYNVGLNEQFFISTQSRLYRGIDEYKGVHRLIFDIETTGLRYQNARIFAIGLKDNRGFEKILEVKKNNDDEEERELIITFFKVLIYINSAIISGYFSENFDFDFILGRANILNVDLSKIITTLKDDVTIKRRANASLKYGNTVEKYVATEMWGFSVTDINHSAKKTAAINSDIKNTKLKYIAKFEKIAKPDRIYIDGKDNSIGKFFTDNKLFLIDNVNNYIKVPEEHQKQCGELYRLQLNKGNISDNEYTNQRNRILNENLGFINWFRTEALPKKMTTFISGKRLVKRYLLDDLWETIEIDELYNQSSFMLAKIIPTTYSRICTMGTAAIWNLLLTTWSYENDIAIPISDVKDNFSGGLVRCYKTGYTERVIKIDYASLYPFIQLSEGVFPIFDITGVMKNMLLYLTTTRNIYKKLAIDDKLNNEEVLLLKELDHDVYDKYVNNAITDNDKASFNVKQLPIKILNNSLFGALGSAISFNWSDNVCAARITCTGRLHLRHAISWFRKFNCIPLLAVTDGINFHYPEKTNIMINDGIVNEMVNEDLIDNMWKYGDSVGISALIKKFNIDEMKNSPNTSRRGDYMSVDDDGKSISCLNLSRINYAMLSEVKNKMKIKLTGNTIKSKAMPEYIEDFIDRGLNLILNGKGKEFVEYYYDYADNIRYMLIPLKKIASKSKIKMTISNYLNRGKDKNGRNKAMQAHMELLIQERENIARELFKEHIDEFILDKENKTIDDFTLTEIIKLVSNYMPPEPELDSVVYYVNTGYRKSHGDSKMIKDLKTKEERFCSTMISSKDLADNQNMVGIYNYEKYLDAFNKRVLTLLGGFDPDIRKRILVKIAKDGTLVKEMFTNNELKLMNFDSDDFDESMYLEDKEVKFWNKTGYDPRLVWDGFKMHDDDKIHFEIYDHALNYLNEKMRTNNKPIIKSVNEQLLKDDMVLIKDNSKYSVGQFNGISIQMIRDDVKIPKCDVEIELDRKAEEKRKKIGDCEITLAKKSETDIYLESEIKLRDMIFVEFKEKYKIPNDVSMNELFSKIENSSLAFDDYLAERKYELNYQEVEYLGIDGDE